MLAIFKLSCCGREMVFGRFSGNELHQTTLERCPNCHKEKVGLLFERYQDDNDLGIHENGKWDALQVLLPARTKRST
jgi:hypothetical protein